MKIRNKIVLFFSGLSLIIVVLGMIVFYMQSLAIRNNAEEKIKEVKRNFYNTVERDTEKLSAALKVFVDSDKYKKVFLQNNREQLYDRVLPLYNELRAKFLITHFYFISPDGRVFLRVHDKDIYNDPVTRVSFLKAKNCQQAGSEIELGKTAFALRVVSPYYDGNILIGYVEFGEEINHFLKAIKGDSGNEYAIIVDKESVNKDKYAEMLKNQGVRNNWDDLPKHIIIGSTTSKKIEITKNFLSEENFNKIDQGHIYIGNLKSNSKIFYCGGFKIKGAHDRNLGIMLSMIDSTSEVKAAQRILVGILAVALFLLMITLALSTYLSRIISRPLSKLVDATSEVAQGNFEKQTIDLESNDEIGQLSKAFDAMINNLKKSTTSIVNLEKEMTERKRMETSLMEEKNFTDSAINSLPGIFYLLNSDGHFLRWNRNFEIVSEYSSEEMKKIHALDLFPEEEKNLVGERIKVTFVNGESNVEATLVSKNGIKTPYYFTGHLLVLGEMLYLVGMGLDIAERKNMEIALKNSEKRQRAIYESSADAIMVLEPPLWRFTAGNLSTIKMFMARDESEFISKTPHDLSPEYQPDGKRSSEKALEMINTAMKNGSHFFEWTHKKINGKEFPATVLLTKVSLCDKKFLQATVRDITDFVRNEKKLKKQTALMEYIAAHDRLTGITNRRTFIKFTNLIFQTCKRYRERFSVLEIDVDNFKGINDQYGHDAGDLVLQSVVSAIKQRIRAGDLLARIGGDEFGLVFTEIGDVEGAGFLADSIVKLFSKPLDINGKLIPVSVSIGIACYNPANDVNNFDELLKQADIAMYKAKERGRNCFDSFDTLQG